MAMATRVAKRPRTAQGKVFAAPVGGWVANRALANPLEPGVKQGAAVLDNYFPRSGTVKLRRGKQRYATLESVTLPVTALFSYRNGANRKLFGANEETVYDLTTVLMPYGADLVTENDEEIGDGTDAFGFASTTGLDRISGFSGGDWVVVQFATTGGVFLVGVNGEDDGLIYDGAEFWPNFPGGTYKLDYTGETDAFVEGETVTGGTSTATAKVFKDVPTTGGAGTLYLYDVVGDFQNAETLAGSGDGAASADGVEYLASPGVTFGDTALTTADMDYVWVYRNRLWFAQKSSLVAWYMEDADAIGGVATPFPLSGIFSMGGSLVFGQGWSLEGGAMGGLSEQCIFVSSEGEVAIYQGNYPGTADTWNKVGVYRIGRPLGNKAFIRGGGDLAIATSVGLVPLSKAISLDVTSLNVATVSYFIADAWSDACRDRGLDGWTCHLWPEEKMALVSPPDLIGSSFPVLFVANAETGAWCRFTGWRAHCMEVFEGYLFFGSDNGEVYMANASGLDDGETYTGTVIPLFEDLGNPSAMKVGQIVRAVSRANATVNQQCSINYDFDDNTPAPPDASLNNSTNTWGSAVWGSAVWGQSTPAVISQGWQSGGGYGYTLAPCYQVTSGSVAPIDDELIRLEVTYSSAELVT